MISTGLNLIQIRRVIRSRENDQLLNLKKLVLLSHIMSGSLILNKIAFAILLNNFLDE